MARPNPRSLLRSLQKVALAHDLLLLRYSESNYLPAHLKRVLQAMEIEVTVDVGANIGQTVSEVRQTGFGGPIISFEPTPHLFAALHAKFENDPAWSGHQVALGSEAGKLTLHRYREESLNSFLIPTAFGASRFKTMAEDPVGHVEVDIVRLDTIWPDLGITGNTLLKIDTQGYDLEVLAGSSGCMDRIAAVLMEVPINQIYEGMPSMNEIFQKMETLGFQLSGLFPITRDRKRLRLVEANCMFLRSDLFNKPPSQRIAAS